MSLQFTVHGTPAPQGSKKGFVNPRTGRAIVVDDNKKPLRTWREDVKHAAMDALAGRPALEGPVSVNVRFYVKRPAAHYGRRNGVPYLKETAPTYPITKPDGDKLQRSTFDALKTAGVYRDDSQIAEYLVMKLYADGPHAELVQPGAVISVGPLAEPTVAAPAGAREPEGALF